MMMGHISNIACDVRFIFLCYVLFSCIFRFFLQLRIRLMMSCMISLQRCLYRLLFLFLDACHYRIFACIVTLIFYFISLYICFCIGENRLDDVLKYKCLYDMKTRINSTKGAKISAIFGRSYLRTSKSWSAIKSTIVLPPMVYAEMFDYFLQHFENSLLLDKNDSENVMNDASLVWAINFYEALKLRQDKRKLEAQKRLKGEAVIAARDAELSDWEDSDDENYVAKQRNHDDDDDDEGGKEGGGNVVNVIIEKIEKVVVDDNNDENLKSVN